MALRNPVYGKAGRGSNNPEPEQDSPTIQNRNRILRVLTRVLMPQPERNRPRPGSPPFLSYASCSAYGHWVRPKKSKPNRRESACSNTTAAGTGTPTRLRCPTSSPLPTNKPEWDWIRCHPPWKWAARICSTILSCILRGMGMWCSARPKSKTCEPICAEAVSCISMTITAWTRSSAGK